MKKLISVFLTIAMLMTLGAAAFAETVTPVSGDSSRNVTASYQAPGSSNVPTVYYVTVEWAENSNTITYSGGSLTYRWDAGTTKYVLENVSGAGWTGSASYTITVTNRSNASVTAAASWAAASGITATASLGSNITLESAAAGVTIANNASGSPKSGTIAVTINTPTAGTISTDGETIGTISVSISK